MNAPVEEPDGSTECWVETSEPETAARREVTAIAALAASPDE